jgi:hypothetical protein
LFNLCDEVTLLDERGEERRFVGAALCGLVRGRRNSRAGLWDCLPRRETLKRLEFFVSFCFKTKRKRRILIMRKIQMDVSTLNFCDPSGIILIIYTL